MIRSWRHPEIVEEKVQEVLDGEIKEMPQR